MTDEHRQNVIEKRDPIPPGVYWVDVVSMTFDDFFARLQAFSRWLRIHGDTVKVLKEQDTEKVFAPLDANWNWHAASEQGFHRWILFEVTAPTERWPLDAKLGLPTIADYGKVTAPPAQPDPAPFSFPDLGDLGKLLSGGLGLFIILYALTRK